MRDINSKHVGGTPAPDRREIPELSDGSLDALVWAVIERHRIIDQHALHRFCSQPDNLTPWVPDPAMRARLSRRLAERLAPLSTASRKRTPAHLGNDDSRAPAIVDEFRPASSSQIIG